MHRIFIVAALLICLFPGLSVAQEPVPGDSCTAYPEGAAMQSGGPELGGAYHFMTCASGVWVERVNEPACDTNPDPFAVATLSDQALSTLVVSEIVPIVGLTCDGSVSVSGQGTPQYRICSDGACSTVPHNWTSTTGIISNGEFVQFRLTTAATAATNHVASILVGSGPTRTWTVRTVGPKTVFITSTTHTGDLGGLAGADAICQARATAASLPGTYRAWLSTATVNASSRVTQSNLGYVMVNGTKIADNWADLVDGDIDNLINRTEIGTTTSGQYVWTATNQSGIYESSSGSCTNWGNGTMSYSASVGYNASSLNWWSYYSSTMCNSSFHIYCFEI